MALHLQHHIQGMHAVHGEFRCNVGKTAQNISRICMHILDIPRCKRRLKISVHGNTMEIL